jgi:glycosyltransferase involved in cell wall biosynthesis
MKIALLSEKYTPDVGGLAISTARLARLLTSAGRSVRVFCPSLSLAASEKRTLTHNGIHLTRFGPRKRLDDTLVDWFELIVEEHKREPFEIIHAYYLTQAGFVAAYAGKYLGIPSVVSIRGNDIERAPFDPAKFSHVLFTLQQASALTTNATELMKKAQAFVDREVTLIPNGIDTNLFTPLDRNDILAKALGILVDQPTLGFAGELREKKGLSTLLHAYTQVNSRLPATLLVIGDVRGGEDKRVFDELRSSIPNAKIIVTGYVSNQDLPSYYSLVDVFVHPSLRDGMPNALLEAMACEIPVIATPVGGILDAVQDCENGRIVPVGDVNGLAAAIQEILSDKAMQKHLGRSARLTVQTKYTPENELNGNLAIYRKVGLKF